MSDIKDDAEYERRKDLLEKHREQASRSLRSFMVGRVTPGFDRVAEALETIPDREKK